MAKMGRPKAENPKKNLVGFKMTDTEIEKLKEYASRHNMSITQVLQRGVDVQYAMEKLNL